MFPSSSARIRKIVHTWSLDDNDIQTLCYLASPDLSGLRCGLVWPWAALLHHLLVEHLATEHYRTVEFYSAGVT